MIRSATIDDLPILVTLESSCFDQDSFTRRILRHLLTKGRAVTLIDYKKTETYGYCTILFRKGSTRARLYSIAVHPKYHGLGIGLILLKAAEKAALQVGCREMVLEVREDNVKAVRFYEKAGYSLFGKYKGFYEDHADALRFQKGLK